MGLCSGTVAYSKQKPKRAKLEESSPNEQMENFEKEIINCNGQNMLVNYRVVKEQWEKIQIEGTFMRSKTQGLVMGEKNKYFLNLEKHNYNSKYIIKLVCNDKTITNPS